MISVKIIYDEFPWKIDIGSGCRLTLGWWQNSQKWLDDVIGIDCWKFDDTDAYGCIVKVKTEQDAALIKLRFEGTFP